MARQETADMLVEVIGLEGTLRLIQEYKGKQITIPSGRGRPGTFSAWLDDNLGIEPARRLRARCANERITVPMAKDQARQARNRMLIADYDAGMPMLELIHKYDLCERQIRAILNSPAPTSALIALPRDDRQLGLF